MATEGGLAQPFSCADARVPSTLSQMAWFTGHRSPTTYDHVVNAARSSLPQVHACQLDSDILWQPKSGRGMQSATPIGKAADQRVRVRHVAESPS